MNHAETSDGPGIDREDERRKVGQMIDLDVLLAELRNGISLLAQCRGERKPGGDDVSRDHGIARFDPEAVAQPGGIGPGRVKAGQVDRCEAVLGTGIG